ncbi:unnamed protein product [Brachionus calyciflorus]|uniref:Uncharacterized protein n=1 Tax=Brachionus calyciflorus TaxID=104777 RepID=A0A814G3H3_9BILA|nr:unnamed protein product [Brachionus calyciflorus]
MVLAILLSIRLEYCLGFSCTTGSRILYALRERVYPHKPKRFENDPDVVNDLFIKGIKLPSIKQINNFLSNTYKPKENDQLNSKSNFCYGDLQKMIDKYSLVPDNEHEAFINDSVIDVNSLIEQESEGEK